MKNRYIKKKNKVLSLIIKIFLLLFLILLTIYTYNAFLLHISSLDERNVKYFLGMQAYIIKTNSMEPELSKDDIIIVKKRVPEEINIGDVITFSSGGEIITHRISKIDRQTRLISTKGDTNTIPDVQKIEYDDIRGVMIFKIPRFWRILTKTQNILYILLLFIGLVTLYLHSRRMLRKSKIRRLKKKKEDKRIKEYDPEVSTKNN